MFLPFLLAFLAIIFFSYNQQRIGLILWLLQLISIITIFLPRIINILNLRF